MSLDPYIPPNPATGFESLAQSLAIGNITGPYDIVVSNPQKVAFAGNIVLDNNNGGGGADIVIDSIPANVGPPLTRQVFVETATNKLKHQTSVQETLAQTLALGNTTGANDIIVSNPQKISFAGNIRMNMAGSQFIVDSIPLNPGPTLPEIGFDNTTNALKYQSGPANSYPTQPYDGNPDGNPGEIANIQYLNNANIGMCSGGSYGGTYASATNSWGLFPPQPNFTLPPLVFSTLGVKPYLSTAKSSLPVGTGLVIKNRIWFRLRTTIVFNGQINDYFGLCFTITNATTGQTITNQNFYSIGNVGPNIAPLMKWIKPIYDSPTSPTATYYPVYMEDCFNVGTAGFCNINDQIVVNVYGGFLNVGTSGTYVGGPNILEGMEQGFTGP